MTSSATGFRHPHAEDAIVRQPVLIITLAKTRTKRALSFYAFSQTVAAKKWPFGQQKHKVRSKA
jgi:hypothetical protein